MTRQIRNITCSLCKNEYKSIGIATHLRDSHDLTVDEYVNKTGHEYRRLKIYYNSLESKFECKICFEKFHSNKRLFHHIKQHNIENNDYIKKYILNNDIFCKCGCGAEVSLLTIPPYRQQFISGHNSKGINNGRYNKKVLDSTKSLMSKAAINRIGTSNKKDTFLENHFSNFLDILNIEYKKQYITEYGCVDFYLPAYNILIDIDGKFWHPKKIENLNFLTLSNIINDYKKVNNLQNFYKIHEDDLFKLRTFDDIFNYSYKQDFSVNFNTVILSKEFLMSYKKVKGDKKLEEKISLLIKFIRTFQPKFPNIPKNKELDYIKGFISNYNLSENYQNFTFKNNSTNIGVNYLKSDFDSYWNSKYKDNKLTPKEVWEDNDILKKIIKYRIGLNNTNETFNFSLHQVLRGISAFRYTISFFKPIVAASIYYHFLKDNPTPVVLDPCAGFGGRLLGFKSKYPNGIYIGIEPNTSTYNELLKLSSAFTNVLLFNCKFEDFDTEKYKFDMAFTSIPYYDLEIYSEHQEYNSFENWKETFINKIKNTPNIIVNIPENLRELFDNVKAEYYLESNSSHFNKNQNKKIEYILELKNN